MNGFSVTFEIVNEASAENGESADSGFVGENLSLRDAFEAVCLTRTCFCGGISMIEANEYPVRAPRWITVYNGMEYKTGDFENRSLHFPDHITPASRRRVFKLMTA
jgi:hypothetical protein